jgi:hypothetical protein
MDELKAEGNAHFQHEKYEEAIASYTKGIPLSNFSR